MTFKAYISRVWSAVTNEDTEFEDVRAFQEKFGQLSYHFPGFLTRRKTEERARFLQEELNEFLTAETLEDQADALVDLVYVAKGTAVMMGLPWKQLWNDVQGANMRKVAGITHRGNLVDVMKPPGWQKPVGGLILAQNGWDFGSTPYFDFPNHMLRDDAANLALQPLDAPSVIGGLGQGFIDMDGPK